MGSMILDMGRLVSTISAVMSCPSVTVPSNPPASSARFKLRQRPLGVVQQRPRPEDVPVAGIAEQGDHGQRFQVRPERGTAERALASSNPNHVSPDAGT